MKNMLNYFESVSIFVFRRAAIWKLVIGDDFFQTYVVARANESLDFFIGLPKKIFNLLVW